MGKWERFDGTKIEGPFEEQELLEAIAGGLEPSVVIRKVGDEDWKPLSAFPQFALAVERARGKAKASTARRWRLPVAAGMTVLLLLIVNTFWLGVGASVEASCNSTGAGEMTCLFTNRGILPASTCWQMTVRHAGDSTGLRSIPMCSGVLWPTSSTSTEVRHAFVEQSPGPYCIGDRTFKEIGSKSWSDFCAVNVEPAR